MRFCEARLAALGPSRLTREAQFRYVLNLATRFQDVAKLALKAHYGNDEVFDDGRYNQKLKLATKVVKRNSAFAEDIQEYGHTMEFEKANDEKSSSLSQTNGDPPNRFGAQPAVTFGTPSPISVTPKLGAPMPQSNDGSEETKSQKKVRYEPDYTELEDIIMAGQNVQRQNPKGGIRRWLDKIYKESQGFGLTFDASILPIVWKKQSTNWGK